MVLERKYQLQVDSVINIVLQHLSEVIARFLHYFFLHVIMKLLISYYIQLSNESKFSQIGLFCELRWTITM